MKVTPLELSEPESAKSGCVAGDAFPAGNEDAKAHADSAAGKVVGAMSVARESQGRLMPVRRTVSASEV
jgi:hypothetical protein